MHQQKCARMPPKNGSTNNGCRATSSPARGAGKSTAILKLLQTRGDGNWAVLVNEIGDVGERPRGAVTPPRRSERRLHLLCDGGPCGPALTRLLKKRPTRLLIEPSGLGHVAELSEHLQKELSNALELRGSRASCRATAILLWAEAPLYRDMVHASDLLILNRRDVDASDTDVDTWAQVTPQKRRWPTAARVLQVGRRPPRRCYNRAGARPAPRRTTNTGRSARSRTRRLEAHRKPRRAA